MLNPQLLFKHLLTWCSPFLERGRLAKRSLTFLIPSFLLGCLLAWFPHGLPSNAQAVPPTAVAVGVAPETVVAKSGLWYYPPGVPTYGCEVTPVPDLQVKFQRGTLTLRRFREPLVAARWTETVPEWLRTYVPKEEVALAHPTNFGERFQRDITGQSSYRPPIVVLHETVIPAWLTVKSFQTAHWNGAAQASYHALIKLDGTIFYMVPPDKRAFGAGNSQFSGANGIETVRTTREFPPSVNNFAYHISFESPPDGQRDGPGHSGYTQAQYLSAAWLVAKTGVPEDRVTTHQGVDRSGSRTDPRSFDQATFTNLLRQFPRTNEIKIGC